MGFVTELESRLNEIKNKTELKEVVNDHITKINANAKNEYPYLIFRVVSDNNPDINKPNQNPNYTVSMMLANKHYQGSTLTLAEQQDELKSLLRKIILSIPASTNDFVLNGSATSEYGWDQHNDSLIVASMNVTIRGFECVTKV